LYIYTVKIKISLKWNNHKKKLHNLTNTFKSYVTFKSIVWHHRIQAAEYLWWFHENAVNVSKTFYQLSRSFCLLDDTYVRIPCLRKTTGCGLKRSQKVKPRTIVNLSLYISTSSTISTLMSWAKQHSTQTKTKSKTKMAFQISRPESEADKSSSRYLQEKDSDPVHGVSSQLQLKSSLSSKASSQTLNKQEVLHRIRHRKSLNRIKGAFEGLLGSSKGNTASAQEQIWLEQYDIFSAPWNICNQLQQWNCIIIRQTTSFKRSRNDCHCKWTIRFNL